MGGKERVCVREREFGCERVDGNVTKDEEQKLPSFKTCWQELDSFTETTELEGFTSLFLRSID